MRRGPGRWRLAGGLLFVGTAGDRIVPRRATAATGKVLREYKLDAVTEGAPAVYEVDGREYADDPRRRRGPVRAQGRDRPRAEPLRAPRAAEAVQGFLDKPPFAIPAGKRVPSATLVAAGLRNRVSAFAETTQWSRSGMDLYSAGRKSGTER